MSAHNALVGTVSIPGALVLAALLQSASAQQPRAVVPARPQPAAGAPGNRPATPANSQPPGSPQGDPVYGTPPQPAAARNPNAQVPRAAFPPDPSPVGPKPTGQQPGAAPATGPAPPIPRTPAGAGVRPVQHLQPSLPPLSPEQEAELDRILAAWERESDKIKTLSAEFTLFEYGDPFDQPAVASTPPKKKRESSGEIHFAAPDKGSFRELKGGDQRWMCDGTSIYEFKAKEKELHEYRLPEELRGTAISKGPLPFVFGAKADVMKQRYAMRVVTPPDAQSQIWIEAWPRTQQDAANFNHVQVILDTNAMLPMAIRMYDIDHNPPKLQKFKVYVFANTKVNGTWDQIKNFFTRPTTPPLWKRVVENVPTSPPAGGPAPAPSVQVRPGMAPARPAQAATADKRNQPVAVPARPK